jgi:hypothetical protein
VMSEPAGAGMHDALRFTIDSWPCQQQRFESGRLGCAIPLVLLC